jgi:hypothetical protein
VQVEGNGKIKKQFTEWHCAAGVGAKLRVKSVASDCATPCSANVRRKMSFAMGTAKLDRMLWLGMLLMMVVASLAQEKPGTSLAPSKMPKLGTVDQRFVSYNVEMVEVTGGRFWKPYKSTVPAQEAPKLSTPLQANQQVGDSASIFQYRPPIDLSSPRLRILAEALGPAYIRVSGSWANSVYFQNDDLPALKEPPKGFRSVLTRAEWKGVIDFAHAVNARIVTSVAISPGARDANGVWTPDQAKALFDYTKSIGGSIAATEFMNEPTFPGPGGAPKGYDAAAFARDVKVFEPFLRKEMPTTIFLGPGSIGEGSSLMPAGAMVKLPLSTDKIMEATGPVFDAFSYHFYASVSSRCAGNTTVAQAFTADWLDRTVAGEAFYAEARDKYLPGKPIWLTETAQAACGGDQFAGQFVDSFRYLNQLGILAQKGVLAVMHNTLAASDYGLLNEETNEPRPDYWAALLWKRTMGAVVLDPGVTGGPSLRVYAQCMKGHKGGVTLLAMNIDPKQEQKLIIPLPADRYTLTAPDLTSKTVLLNGVALQAGQDGTLPEIKGLRVKPGALQLAPASITFLTTPSARNAGCM